MTATLRGLYVAIGLILLNMTTVYSQNRNFTAPDFAFPQKVSRASLTALDGAASKGDGPATVRALIDYTLAEGMIARSNLSAALARLDSVRGLPSTSGATAAMLMTLKATVYQQLYSREQWKYDRRTPASATLPDDYTEWDGEQWRSVIGGLLSEALADSAALRREPLTAWKGVVNQDRITAVYYPTLLDFVATKAIEIYSSWGTGPAYFPYSLVDEAADARQVFQFTPLRRSPMGSRIVELYDMLVAGARTGSAAEVNYRLGRLNYLLDNAADNDEGWDTSRYKAYTRLYNSFAERDPKGEYAGDILLGLPTTQRYAKEVYALIGDFLKGHPRYWRADCLRNILADLSRKELSVTGPEVAGPGREVTLTVTMRNVPTATVNIYDVSSSDPERDSYTSSSLSGLTPVAVIPVKASGTVPFSDTVKVTHRFDRMGAYIAVATAPGAVTERRESFQKIRVTSMALSFSSMARGRSLWTVDATTGAPVEGATVSVNPSPYRQGSVAKAIGKTDAQGGLRVETNISGMAIASRGSDRFAAPIYISDFNYSQPDKWSPRATAFTSLPLYHHGDTVGWTAVCYEARGGLCRPRAGAEVEIVVRDANRQSIDTVKCVADRFGRVHGSTVIPAEGLSGRFSILVDGVTACWMEVSDYKLPTFHVAELLAASDVPEKGAVTLRGKAISYSGFPIQDAKVSVALSVSSGWRWGRQYDVATLTATTDSKGEFEAVVDAEMLANSPVPQGFYTARVTVTSESGESQAGTVSFSRGKRYHISALVPANQSMKDGKLIIKATVKDYADSVVKAGVRVSLIAQSGDTVKNTVASPSTTLDIRNIMQGVYTLVLECEGAETVKNRIVLYDPSAQESPEPSELIWMPERQVIADRNGQGEWLVAAAVPTHVLATLWVPDSVLWQKWIAVGAGFNRLGINLPEGVDEATLTYGATGDYRTANGSVRVTRTDSARGLKIVAESFRDKLTPGETETLMLRVTDLRGQGREAAVIAGMYNAALDAVTGGQASWNFEAQRGRQTYFYLNISNMQGEWSSFRSFRTKESRLKCPQLVNPEFNLWGRSLYSYMNGGPVMLSGMKSRASMADGIELAEEEVVYESVEQLKTAAPMMATTGAAYKMQASGVMNDMKEEVAEDATAVEGDAGDTDAPSEAPGDDFVYRGEAEALAFFRPDLVTEADGSLALRFTLPEANATWRLRLLALTDSLLSASLSRELTVARQLMVQPNLPRFLRRGDTAVVPATVMNNGDSLLSVNVMMECFDPATNRTVSRKDTIVNIAPHATALMSISVIVPEDITALGVRVKALSDEGSDGEQSMIPVLASDMRVMESEPFYLPAGGGEVKLPVPAGVATGSVSLQVCGNPVWSVVTALPGLMAGEAVTSPEAMRAIFAASVAAGLLRDNPAIERVLKEWTVKDASSDHLTSMLEKNEDLKLMMLGATPWMSDAADDTERMRRLALLFDSKLISKTLSNNISLLERLATAEGGWKWSPQSDDMSRWATAEVLSLAGRLVNLGYLPESGKLRAMIDKALAHDTAETMKEFKKYPQGDYTSYVWRHTQFAPLGIGVPSQAITDATVNRILGSWRKASLATKALDAMLLNSHGYKAVARQIIESIQEFAVSSPEKGMWFPSLTEDNWLGSMDRLGTTAFILDTFHAIEPRSAAIEQLRQWLILSKGAQNWGSSATATDVVAAVLTTSRTPASASAEVHIKVNGKSIASDEIDRVTGEWTASLDAEKSAGKDVKVSVKSPSPSWGALYSSYQAESHEIEAQACEQLSITRSFIPAGSPLEAGSKVKVVLTLKVSEDMDYVVVDDSRGACFEPVEQLPATVWADGVRAYRVSSDTATRFFIDRLPRGTYQLTYYLYVNNAGSYSSGIATAQSQYAPRFTAHSSGSKITVK